MDKNIKSWEHIQNDKGQWVRIPITHLCNKCRETSKYGDETGWYCTIHWIEKQTELINASCNKEQP